MNPTFSMSPTVDHCRKVGQYPAPSAVQIVAQAFGKPQTVAAQMLKLSDDRCPAGPLARLVAALYAGGRGDVAERLCLPLDIARKHIKPKLTIDLIADAQHTDLLEDIAENEARAFHTVESKRRWLRALKANHEKEAEEIAGLEAELAGC